MWQTNISAWCPGNSCVPIYFRLYYIVYEDYKMYMYLVGLKHSPSATFQLLETVGIWNILMILWLKSKIMW
jgi:hypothetical protein